MIKATKQIDLLDKIIEKKFNNKVINSFKNTDKKQSMLNTKRNLLRILSLYKKCQ